MNAFSLITEARWNDHRDDEVDPIFADAEDPDVTLDQLADMVKKSFGVGDERLRELKGLVKTVGREQAPLRKTRDGSYIIQSAQMGEYTDFNDQANYAFLRKKYAWLHEISGSLGFDEDKGAADHRTFEDFLATIPHEEWVDFFSDMNDLAQHGSLDDDGAQELENKEQARWMKEDGGPDLIKAMVSSVDDAYEAYLLSKVTPDMIWEWCHETEHYPETQGDGSVWLDMSRLGKEREAQTWFLDQSEDDFAGWEQIKKAQFEDLAGELLDRLLREMAGQDEQIAFVYNKLDGPRLWEVFLKTFPDEPRYAGDPYWYWWKLWNEETGRWRLGYQYELHSGDAWKPGLVQAYDYLKQQEWFWEMLRNWDSRGPDEHPEFKFEAKEQVPLEAEPDPDDPEIFMKYGGGIEEEVVYEDDKIVGLYPRDYYALNYHLRRAGQEEITKKTWDDYFKYQDIFIVQGKQPVDLLGREEKRELAVLWGDSDVPLKVWTGHPHLRSKSPPLDEVLANPEYGRSIRKMLLDYYRERLEKDHRAGNVLMQLGGPREIRRGEHKGHIEIGAYRVPLGLYYISKHKYRYAAKAFQRDIKTILPTGVWLIYDGVEDLLPVFKNDNVATEVFAGDHYEWFQDMESPPVEDVVPFLDKKAIDHIRNVMVNRKVWFPDGGEDQRGDWVVLTKRLLDQYDDATILDWIASVSAEDQEEGVWEDIIDAIRRDGSDLLQSASQDNVHKAYVKAAVSAIEGIEHKWGAHPTKRYKSGESFETFEVFVPWAAIKDFAEKYQDEHGDACSETLEALAVDVNKDTADVDANDYAASWHDIDKETAGAQFNAIYELERPAQYEDPKQLQLPMESLGVAEPDMDDPTLNQHLLSGIPVRLEQQIRQQLEEYAHLQGIQIKDVAFDLQPEDDSKGMPCNAATFSVRFRPAGALLDLALDGDNDYVWHCLARMRLSPLVRRAFEADYTVGSPVLADCRKSHPGCVCIQYPFWLLRKSYYPGEGLFSDVPF